MKQNSCSGSPEYKRSERQKLQPKTTISHKTWSQLSGPLNEFLISCDGRHSCSFNFRVFDQDNNGYITLDELQRAMQMIGENVTDAQLNEMLALADLDKDGKINYEGDVCLVSHKLPHFADNFLSFSTCRVREAAVVNGYSTHHTKYSSL